MSRKRRRARGHGTVYRRGSWWYISWREGTRRVVARFPREDLARETLEKKIAKVALGLAGEARPEPKPAPSTIAALAEEWLKRRVVTHKAGDDDRSRFKMHLIPFFGRMLPGEVTAATLREFIEKKLQTKVARGAEEEGDRPNLSSTSVGHLVRTLSTFMQDLLERGLVDANPCFRLPRSTKRLIRNAHDPKDTPFLRTKEDIRRVYLALPEPYNAMFAVGALAGLRTGEVIGIDWRDVSLDTRRIHVRRQVQDGRLCELKDKETRMAPIVDALLPILQQWHLRTGGAGLLFRPKHRSRGGRSDLGRPAQFIRQHTVNERLAKALEACGLQAPTEDPKAHQGADGAPRLNWYRCTRHTFASHWVLDGRSMERLRLILGHEDLTTTMRYAHLAPGSFSAEDLAAVSVNLNQPGGKVLPLVQRPAETSSATGIATDPLAAEGPSC